VDFTAQLGVMRELPLGKRHLAQGRRIVVASADRVLINGLVHSLEGIGSLVGAASTEAEALACLSITAADLLICSDQLERGNGPSLVAAAKAQQPSLRCLMLIQRPLLNTIHAAAKAQCDGLCSHERIDNGGLLSVLRAMESDGSHMDPVIAGVANHDRGAGKIDHLLSDVLSLREEDVLRGLCKGLSNQEIADQLHLSIETTKHCVTGLLRKLDTKSRIQAVLIAFQRNLVDPPLPTPRWTPSA
jgi:DNA-binding NarL/FixJ family response regulator